MDGKRVMDRVDTIECLVSQINALMDLIYGADDMVDRKSIKAVAEMGLTMLTEIGVETEKIHEMWRKELLEDEGD